MPLEQLVEGLLPRARVRGGGVGEDPVHVEQARLDAVREPDHAGRVADRALSSAAVAAATQVPNARKVLVLAAGGTISMKGELESGHEGVLPALDGEGLVEAVEGLSAFPGVEGRTVVNKPSAHLTLDDQLDICRQARDAARRGTGVVVTHGTDTLEETAMLCDILHDAEAPIVFTGAIRPASAPGADGPANLLDAVSVAASAEAAGMGVLVCFGGEIHHARCVRKTDTVSLVAFSSPQTGLLGRVTEGHPIIWSRIPRNPPLDPPNLDKQRADRAHRRRATTAPSPGPRSPPTPTGS